jgi:hypothetical protein
MAKKAEATKEPVSDIVVTKLNVVPNTAKPQNGKAHLKMRSITIKILPEQFDNIKKYASEMNMSIPVLTLELVEGFLSKREKETQKKPAKK